MRLQTLLEQIPADERQAVAAAHVLAPDAAPAQIAEHLAQSRVLLNLLKNALRPVTNLIERLAAFGPEAELDADILGDVPAARLAAAHRAGLLFLLPSAAQPRKVVLPLEYLLMREIRRPPSTDLASGLRVLGLEEIRRLARLLDLAESRHPALTSADVHDGLLERAEELAAGLPAGERAVLDALLERGGEMEASALDREHRLVPGAPGQLPSLADVFGTGHIRGRPTDFQRLVHKGLVHGATEANTVASRLVRVFVPTELVQRVSSAWAERRAAEEAELRARAVAPDPPAGVRPATADLRSTLRAFAVAVEAVEFRFGRGGEAHARTAGMLEDLVALSRSDQERLAALGQTMGVFRIEADRLALAPDAATRLDRAGRAFRQDVEEALSREAGSPDPLRPRLRRLLLTRFRRLSGEWLRVRRLPELLRADPEYRRTLAIHRIDPDHESAWLAEPLEELRLAGHVDLDGQDGRATLARHRAPADPDPPEVPERALVVPPNFEVVAPLAAPFALLATLSRFADPKSLDVVAVFALSEASLLRGAATGLSPEEAVDFLARHCAHPLPATVERLARDAAAREGEIRLVRSAGVLFVRDPSLADALQRHPELGPFRLERAGPAVFVLPRGLALDAVQRTLRRIGFGADLDPEARAGGADDDSA
ncbi:MAG: helicase-associated domain-containing protein [Planctomycetes bacterium]|nr:helicase-associated domain-containing protein [Planctomycetota bacterium]